MPNYRRSQMSRHVPTRVTRRTRAALPGVLSLSGLLLSGLLLIATAPASTHAQTPAHGEGDSGASPAAGTLFLHPERFEKEDGTLGTVERGVLYVPVKRSDPAARVISIEFWRFERADDADPDAPPVFVLHGGPGWPGLADDLHEEGYYERRVEPLTRVSDVVVVGQRGIGSSKPNTACEGPPAAPEGVEPSEEEVVQALLETAERCQRYWAEHGLDLSGFTVVEAAADVADVTRALGYDRITVWGVSFGSHWGMTVLRYHPGIVARAVLSGMEGPDHTYDNPTGILNALERIANDAEDSERLADRIPTGGLMAALRETIDRVDEQPVTLKVETEDGDSTEVEIDAEAIRSLADGFYLGRIGDRRREASWPAGILALYRGDYEAAAKRMARPGGGGGGLWITASFFMLDCGSGITPERERRFLADPARDVVGEQSWFYRAVCPAWDADLGNEFRRNFDTEIPTVIVHGNWDMSTPFENALELAPHFQRGRLVVVDRGSHGALREALEEFPSFREALYGFVASGDMSGIPERLELPEPDWVLPEELE